MENFSFIKMHGLGNDFVILDGFESNFALNEKTILLIANRRLGIGCDQILFIKKSEVADAEVLVYNSDGSISEACGNGARCVIAFLANKLGKYEISLIMGLRKITGELLSDDMVILDMGIPEFRWDYIPLIREMGVFQFCEY